MRFAVSRFFRLYPAYWLSLTLALLIFPPLTGESYSTTRILANVTMAQAAFGQRDVIGAYWTLFIELAFYGLCMGLFATRLLADWRAVVGAIFAALGISFAVATYASLHGSHLPANVPLNIALMFLGTLDAARLARARHWREALGCGGQRCLGQPCAADLVANA